MNEPRTILEILHLIKHHAPLCGEEIDAIRRLIEFMDELQLTCGIKNLSHDQMKAIILNIRDFNSGKEGADE